MSDEPKRDDTATCRLCGKLKPKGAGVFFGPRGWHRWNPTCRHEVFVTCPDCDFAKNPKVACSVCGTQEFFS